MSKILAVAFLILALGLSLSARADEPLPDIDPTREWLASEYAEVVFAKFRTRYPEVPLVLDLKDLAGFTAEQKHGFKLNDALRTVVKNYKESKDQQVREKVVNSLKSAFGPSLQNLISRLEYGEEIGTTTRYPRNRALQTWITSQPENSIYPDELMVQALHLEEGHVLRAWALVWNVVREEWILAATRNYAPLRVHFASLTGERHVWKGAAHYVVLPREERGVAFAWKLKSGTPSRHKVESMKNMQMVITKRGDEFSYLYHRVGVELLTMVASQYFGSKHIGWAIGTAGALGEFTKYTKTAGLQTENRKRVANDLAGATSGKALFTFIEQGTDPAQLTKNFSPRTYLHSNPKKYGGDYALPEGVPAHYFGSEVSSQFWAPSMSVEELRLRFFHGVNYDAGVFHPAVLATGDDSERLHRGLADYIEQGAKDAELNALIRQFRSGEFGRPDRPDVKKDLDLTIWRNQKNVEWFEVEFNFDDILPRLNRHLDKVIAAADKWEKAISVKGGVPELPSVFSPSRAHVPEKDTCERVFERGA